jgi:hypothetical protein
LEIGKNRVRYIVPEFLVKQSPKWLAPTHWPGIFGRTIELPRVDEDIGHTLVHFLFSGEYQTLKPEGASGPLNNALEYRRAILVYYAAREYKLDGLVDHAKRKMEVYSEDLSIFQILDITSDVYSELPDGETWFPDYLKTQIKEAFTLNETIFAQEEFLDQIGKTPAYSKALAKIMVDILTSKQAQNRQCTDKDPDNSRATNAHRNCPGGASGGAPGGAPGGEM